MRQTHCLWAILSVAVGGWAMASQGAGKPGSDGGATQPAMKLTLTQALDRAAAVSLMKVAEMTERDTRGSDGNLDITVALKPIRGSGETPQTIDIIKAWGGYRPNNTVALPPDPLNPSPFKKGLQYWFVWSSVHDVFEHRIIMWWPADDLAAPVKELEAAVKADRYAWSPQYVPDVDLFYGRKVDPEKKETTVRVTKANKTLWEKTLPGLPTARYFSWNWCQKRNVASLLADVDAPNDRPFLVIETDADLPAGNELDRPAGRYYLSWMFEADTGCLAVVLVSAPQYPQLGLNRYSLATGHLVFQSENIYCPTGGKAVGAEKEEWWCQVQRRFDPKTGNKISEEKFRLAGPHMEPAPIGVSDKTNPATRTTH